MSTYTELTNRVKETIAVGYDNRITTQQVKLNNPLNEYMGTFVGNVNVSYLSAASGNLNFLSADHAILKDSQFIDSEGNIVSLTAIADLLSWLDVKPADIYNDINNISTLLSNQLSINIKSIQALNNGTVKLSGDNTIEGLNTIYNISCESLSGVIGVLQTLSADNIINNNLSSVNGIINNLSVNNGLSSKYFYTIGNGKTVFTGEEKHGGVLFDFENGVHNISVDNQTTLDQYVKAQIKLSSDNLVKLNTDKAQELSSSVGIAINEKINTLNRSAVEVEPGHIIKSISQTNGIIYATTKQLTKSDIPTLDETQVKDLTTKYATKQEITDSRYIKTDSLRIERYSDEPNKIYLVDYGHQISSAIDCSDFIKDGILQSVELLDNGIGHDSENGPYLVFTWNAAANTQPIWVPIKRFFNIYNTDDNGISIDGYTIRLNYDVVGKATDVHALQDYVTTLSADSSGIIPTLSSGLSSLTLQNAQYLKFSGHITHVEAGESLQTILAKLCEADYNSSIPNNSIFKVEFDEECITAFNTQFGVKFETSDGFILGNNDLVIVHDHNAFNLKLAPTEINHTNTYIQKAGISEYEISEIRQSILEKCQLSSLGNGEFKFIM